MCHLHGNHIAVLLYNLQKIPTEKKTYYEKEKNKRNNINENM